MARIWSDDNEVFIRENFRHKTYAELADHFGVSQKAMESKIRRMGLKKQDYRDEDPTPGLLSPPRIEPEELAVETGPTPIKSASLLPRKAEVSVETDAERKVRLEAEREAAATHKQHREEARGHQLTAKALKAFEMGVKKFHGGAPGKALEAFRKVLEHNPPEGVVKARARQYIAALERQARSAAFNPQDADGYYLQGVILLNDGDPSAGIRSFAKALELAPGDDRILYCQAAAYAQRGDIDDAIEALREAVDINDANRVYALNDPDFVPLVVHEDFRSIVTADPVEV